MMGVSWQGDNQSRRPSFCLASTRSVVCLDPCQDQAAQCCGFCISGEGMIKICVVCGQEFNALRAAKCCSPACSHTRICKGFRNYYAAHADEGRQYSRKYHTAHPEKRGEAWRKWSAKHRPNEPQVRKEQDHKYYEAHVEQTRDRHRKYYEAHREQVREKNCRYRVEHAEEARGSVRRYKGTDRGKAVIVANSLNRRMRLNGISMNADTVVELKAEYGGICPYCNEHIIKGHIDHIVAVAKGGTNDRSNLVWVCKHCNLQKHDMTVLQFMLYRSNALCRVLGALAGPNCHDARWERMLDSQRIGFIACPE